MHDAPDTVDSGRPSDARREARIEIVARMLWDFDAMTPWAGAPETNERIGWRKAVESALDAADAVSEPTPPVVWTKDKWYDTRTEARAVPEPLTPPRDAESGWLESRHEEAPEVESEQAAFEEMAYRSARLPEIFAYAERLEGALRALVAANKQHHNGPADWDRLNAALDSAEALLAESTPQLEENERAK